MTTYAAPARPRTDTPRPRPIGRLSPMQPTSELLDALFRAELHVDDRRWHDAMQRVLQAIGSLLADDAAADLAGSGLMTQQQVANRAHRGLRTVERWWPVLLHLGLITWTRGIPGPGDYQARPGVVRVNKRAIIRMVYDLRRIKDAATRRQRYETRRRLLADIRSAKALWVRCLRRSAKPATSAGLPPSRDSSPPSRRGVVGPVAPSGPPECEHGAVVGRCALCRFAAGNTAKNENDAAAAAAQTMNLPVSLFTMPD